MIQQGGGSREQRAMLATIEAYLAECAGSTGVARLTPGVREALLATPRQRFLPEALRAEAYADRAVPIGCGQTLSQPLIVALMTELLQPRASDRVLEVGTGSGYQAAVLARLVGQVYSLEIIELLARQASARLAALGLTTVEVIVGNGALGLPAQAPFDKIIITAAAPAVPAALIDQLAPGGLIVAPLGEQWYGQALTVLSRDAAGTLTRREVLSVSFVPFVQWQ